MNTITRNEKRPSGENQEQAQRGYLSPRVNITETKDGYCLEAEMPGVNKEGLEVLLEGSELTLIGRRRTEALDATLLYRESANRDYRRVFSLDPAIDTSNIEAKMENGVLKLHLPKAERVKPRKIKVTG
jgi:HSP20 family protein